MTEFLCEMRQLSVALGEDEKLIARALVVLGTVSDLAFPPQALFLSRKVLHHLPNETTAEHTPWRTGWMMK